MTTSGTMVYGMYVSLLADESSASWPYPEGNAESQNEGIQKITLRLLWCGTGYGRQGTPVECTGHTGVPFGYADGPGASTPLSDYDFSTSHPERVDIIENVAHEAFRKAFSPYDAIYVRPKGSPNPAEHTIAVNGDWLDSWANGYTPLFQHSLSFVYYGPVLLNAERALGPGGGQSRFVPVTEAEYRQLMAAIGRGIGNAAAHEIGHQLTLSGMDCGDPDAKLRFHCEGGSTHVYNFFSGSGFSPDPTNPWSTGAQFLFLPDVSIGWTPTAACWLKIPDSGLNPTCPGNR